MEILQNFRGGLGDARVEGARHQCNAGPTRLAPGKNASGVICSLLIGIVDLFPSDSFAQVNQFTALDTAPTSNSIFINVKIEGSIAYVTWGDVLGGIGTPATLALYDVSDPSNIIPRDTETWGSPRTGADFVVHNGMVYVCDLVGGRVRIFDATNPTAIVARGISNSLSQPNGIALDSTTNTLYVGSGFSTGTLTAFNVSNPDAFTFLGSTTTSSGVPLSLNYQNGVVTALQGSPALTTFNVTNPASITSLGSTTTNLSQPVEMDRVGNIVYTTDTGTDRLGIYDVSNPATPSYLGGYTILSPRNVVVEHGIAYTIDAAVNPNRLLAINVTNPASPTLLASTTVNVQNPWNVAVRNGLVAITNLGNDVLALYRASFVGLGTQLNGMVFDDLDGDGIYDFDDPEAQEFGISGVDVRLIRDDDSDGIIDVGESVLETQTVNLGQFTFLDVPAGTYLVEAIDPNGVLIGFELTTASNPVQVSVEPGTIKLDMRFGFRQTPTPTPSPTPSPSETPTPSPTDSLTPSPSETPSPTASLTPSPTDSLTPSPTDSLTPTPSETPSPTASATASPTPPPTVTSSPSPTAAPTPSPVAHAGWKLY